MCSLNRSASFVEPLRLTIGTRRKRFAETLIRLSIDYSEKAQRHVVFGFVPSVSHTGSAARRLHLDRSEREDSA